MTSTTGILRRFALVLTLATAFSLAGCGSAQKKEEGGDDKAPTAQGEDANTMGDSDSGKAMGLQTINFPYDSFVLDDAAKNILRSNAQILKDKKSVKIQVEGHCDQRGGIQYNIALGEKRANAVRRYLADMGVSGDRVTTISYGKERPIDSGSSEEAYAKNRRANFVITSK